MHERDAFFLVQIIFAISVSLYIQEYKYQFVIPTDVIPEEYHAYMYDIDCFNYLHTPKLRVCP